MADSLFAEFPPVSTSEWMAVVERDLKGADFEKRLVATTLDGLRLKPFYRAEDLPERPLGRFAKAGCAMREEIRENAIGEANAHLLSALNRGADEVAVYLYPIGPRIESADDFARLLDGVYIEAVPIRWIAGPLASPVLGLLASESERRGIEPSALRGGFDFDPILDRCLGWIEGPLDDWRTDFQTHARRVLEGWPGLDVLGIRGALIEKAGASVAQELAFTLALLAEYLSAADGLPIDDLLRRTEVSFGVGTNYFLEIAKLRAARPLFAQLAEAFGAEGVPAIHAITTSSSKTVYDPYNNLLRATIEAMAAVIGGADSLSVAAYNQGYQTPDEFSSHLARNTEVLLEHEAHLERVADPLGGSYTVERLTHDIAHAAWELFRRIESEGGFIAAWQSGWIAAELDRVRAERDKAIATRRRTVVGTTVYPNLMERRLADVEDRPGPTVVRPNAGAGIAAWRTDAPAPRTALDPYRPTRPYEALRLAVEAHAEGGGKRPVVLLAKLGDPKMREARAGFCLGFFGAGGYEVRQETFGSPAEVEAGGADMIVLCSSDDEYPELAAAVRSEVPLVVAGYPERSLDALRASGVQGFVHLRSNHVETLREWHARFGIATP